MNTLNGKDLKKYIFFRLKKCKIVPFCSVAFWVFQKRRKHGQLYEKQLALHHGAPENET